MSRHSGLRPWLLQRFSAVYLAVYSIYLAQHFFWYAPADFATWQDYVSSPVISITASLFFLALLLHVWVGVRDILIDYVRRTGLRLFATALLAASLCACGLWTLRILWQVS